MLVLTNIKYVVDCTPTIGQIGLGESGGVELAPFLGQLIMRFLKFYQVDPVAPTASANSIGAKFSNAP